MVRWQATCGGCMTFAEPIAVPTDDEAWQELSRQGWTIYQHTPGSRAYAKCPRCSAKPKEQAHAPRRKARRHQ